MTGPVIDTPQLTSVRNPRVIAVAALHDRRPRRSAGLTLIEGPAQIADAVAAGADLVDLYSLEPADVPVGSTAVVTTVSDAVLGRMAGTRHPRGPVAVVAIPASATLRPVDTVVLWDVSDPGNAGAVVRSAAAFGFDVAATAGSTDVWSPRALRAAAGAQFRTAVVELGDDPLAVLTGAGLTPLAAVVAGGGEVEDIASTDPVALIIGGEAHGLPEAVTSRSTPVSLALDGGVESLNAAVAVGVLMYQLRKRRHPASSTVGGAPSPGR